MPELDDPELDDRTLDDRKRAILEAVVEEYIATAEPVGSSRVAKSRRLGVSSATVRNDMAALESEGYLVQPHTSAGRIPTDKGYRYFVDHLGRIEPLARPQARQVADFFAHAQSALEDMLQETSRLLAGITEHASLVVGPQVEGANVISTQVVAIHPDVAMAVAVLSNGSVEKCVLRLDEDVDARHVETASKAVAAAASQSLLTEIDDPRPTGSDVADRIARLAADGLRGLVRETGHEPVFVGGASNIAAEAGDFSAVETVSGLLELLEQQFLVVSLARNLIDRGLTVSIGSENEQAELRECSVVLAPVAVEGEVAGTVGVLGPTRMNYAQAMAAVTTVSKLLGDRLTS